MWKKWVYENKMAKIWRLSYRRGSHREGRSKHQVRSLKVLVGDVDPVTVLKPNLVLPGPVNNLLPEICNPSRWLLGAHKVGVKAEISDELKVWECILPEERIYLFNQQEEQCVQIVEEIRIKETGMDVADCDKLKGGVGWEKDVRGYPVWGFPMPLGICRTNKLLKIWTPISERDRYHLMDVGQVMLFDCA